VDGISFLGRGKLALRLDKKQLADLPAARTGKFLSPMGRDNEDEECENQRMRFPLN